jgi:predicted short-subunit dehydrogenase-like oxidoreductase (DUF2520 family)
MIIGFVGAGKVGTSFGKYLIQNGFSVAGYYSRSRQSAVAASDYTASRCFAKVEDLVQRVDGIFITTGDDQIDQACGHVVDSVDCLQGKFMVHMSGALSSEVLQRAGDKGAQTFSLHPLQSFADIDLALNDLKQTIFGIEGERELDILKSILDKTGNRYIKLRPEQKTRYHMVACIISNYLVTLLGFGLDLFDSIGIDPEKGMDALLPMIRGTVANVAQLGPDKALTGPIARGDLQTIKKHLENFTSKEGEAADFYNVLCRKTLALATKRKLTDTAQIAEMFKLLS